MSVSPSIQLLPLEENTLREFKNLNLSIFPVTYNDVFYKLALHEPEKLTRLAYVDGKLVGAVCCRIQYNEETKKTSLCIATLGVLAGYRRLRIGSQLLDYVLDTCLKDSMIQEIYLHVQVGNDIALKFYSNYGFEVEERIPNYYKRIEPSDCLVLRKTLKLEKES